MKFIIGLLNHYLKKILIKVAMLKRSFNSYGATFYNGKKVFP